MELSMLTLLPPVLAIVMVLITKRVLLSLGVGIIAAAFLISNYSIGGTFSFIWESFVQVFMEDGALNTWNVYILLFILILGLMTAFVSMMGGTIAFGEWMIKRVKTRVGAQLMTMVLGILIFVDDYFNSLTVGPISKPVTDQHRVSRAKLAYIVDSTAAPVSVIAPISSWGAYIIGIIGVVLVNHQVTDYGAFEAFVRMIPMNFYVWAALGMVLVIAIRQVDFGPMKHHERQAMEFGIVANPETEKVEQELPMSDTHRISDLLVPIGILFATTLGAIYWDGARNTEAGAPLMEVLGEADVSLALFVGGLISVVVTFLMYMRHVAAKRLSIDTLGKGIVVGIKSMLPAIFILTFAWAISYLIGELKTGEYLASLVEASQMNTIFLPALLFVMAGAIAFATGTSWGSFAILLPIAGQIAASTNIELMLPMLAAVLGGAVFGDHCSPISDTTILSATGANCELMDHVTTQLPYALTAAVITVISYIALGLFNSVVIGLIVMVVCFMIVSLFLNKISVTEAKDVAVTK